MGGWPLSAAAAAAAVECDSAAGEVTDRPENLLQSRRPDETDGEEAEAEEVRVGVIPSVESAMGA